MSDYVAGPVMCSASTVYTALKESGLRPGQWACFPGGGGGVGIQGVQLAVAMGLRVIVVDTGAEREALSKEMGAEVFIDFKEVENPPERVMEITGGGAHGVFVTGQSKEPRYQILCLTISQLYSFTRSLSTISVFVAVALSCGMIPKYEPRQSFILTDLTVLDFLLPVNGISTSTLLD